METITLHDQMDSGGSGVADEDEDGGEVVLITVVGLVWRWTNFSVGFQSPHYWYFNLSCPITSQYLVLYCYIPLCILFEH